jgi:hypothetical protein
MDFSRLRSYPDRSPAESPWWWRLPRANEHDRFATGLKALFVVGTLLGAFYLRSTVLIPPRDLAAAINEENFDRIQLGMHEDDLEGLFGRAGTPVRDADWPRGPEELWVRWTDPTDRERWIAVTLRTLHHRGEPMGQPFVAAKKKNGF